MSSFISSSRNRRYTFFLVFFYLMFLVSFCAFVVNPQWFYWRAWEYFEEISYWIPHKNKWRGYELGDIERTLGTKCVKMHYQWKTVASCDRHGARSVPYKSESYGIVFGGDSQMWGSGLSDDQTIPWKVAKKLELPVYNAGKFVFTMHKGLKNLNLCNAKVLVEIPVRAHLNSGYFETAPTLGKGELRNYLHGFDTPKKKSRLHFFEIPPKRYFLPAKLLRPIKLDKWKKSLIGGFKPRSALVQPVVAEVHRVDGIQKLAEGIKARSQAFEEMGYIYVFGMIPGKGVIDVEHLDPSITKLDQLLKDLLIEAGVHYVDIPSEFRRHPLRRKLYQPTDTHINEHGADLVASTVTDYLKKHFSKTLEELKKRDSW